MREGTSGGGVAFNNSKGSDSSARVPGVGKLLNYSCHLGFNLAIFALLALDTILNIGAQDIKVCGINFYNCGEIFFARAL